MKIKSHPFKLIFSRHHQFSQPSLNQYMRSSVTYEILTGPWRHHAGRRNKSGFLLLRRPSNDPPRFIHTCTLNMSATRAYKRVYVYVVLGRRLCVRIQRKIMHKSSHKTSVRAVQQKRTITHNAHGGARKRVTAVASRGVLVLTFRLRL